MIGQIMHRHTSWRHTTNTHTTHPPTHVHARKYALLPNAKKKKLSQLNSTPIQLSFANTNQPNVCSDTDQHVRLAWNSTQPKRNGPTPSGRPRIHAFTYHHACHTMHASPCVQRTVQQKKSLVRSLNKKRWPLFTAYTPTVYWLSMTCSALKILVSSNP